MAVTISWDHKYSASDDGTILSGGDIGNIQDNIEAHSHTAGVDTFINLSDTPANFAGSGDKLTKVNAGATALEFVSMSGDAALAADGAVTVSDLTITSEAEGDVLYFNGTNWIRIAKGSAGQALKMNAGETAPEWASSVRMKTGTYAGSGAASKAITGVGFQPKYLEISPLNNSYYGRYMKTSDIPTKYARCYAGYSDNMFQLDADGFTVYNSGAENYNRSAVTYAYVAMTY